MSEPNKKTLLVGPRVWRANRLRYPGWTIAPKPVRGQVWRSTKHWLTPISSMGAEHSTFERLFAFRELNWRLELVLFPMFTEFAEATEKLLGEINPKAATKTTLNFLQNTPNPTSDVPEEMSLNKNLPPNTFDYEATDIRASWKELAFGLLRFAREQRNLELFDKWIGHIKTNLTISSDDLARICYEQSLWALANLDNDLVTESLRAWPENTALALRMRRVSILLQIGEIEEAAAIARQCYERIQKTARSQHSNLALVSIEAWNVMVLECIQEKLRFPSATPSFDAILLSNVKRRINQLARMKYDPWQLLDQFEKITDIERPVFESETRQQGFHPGWETITNHFGQDDFKQFQPAYEILRFSEEAPFPPKFTGQNLCADSIKAAATWLVSYDPVRSDSMLFHLKDEKFTHEYLSRHRVAAMPEERLQDLYRTAKSGLDSALKGPLSSLSSIEPKAVYTQNNVKTALDIISRLVIRMSVEVQLEILELSLKLYEFEYISRSRFTRAPLESLFRSLFQSLPESILIGRLPAIARLPIPGTKEFRVFNSQSWMHPLHEFSNAVSALIDAEPNDWTQPVENSLTHFDEGNPGVRERALRRLDTLYSFGCMTKAQAEKLGQVYWKESLESGIPHHQPFTREACLVFPAPESIDIESRFKTFTLSFDETTSKEKLTEQLKCWSYANYIARKPDKTRHTIVRWSDDDLQQVMMMIEHVWERLKVADKSESTDARSIANLFGELTPCQLMREVMSSLRDLIIVGSNLLRDRLVKIVNEIHQSRHPIGRVLPVLSLIESEIDVESEMRLELSSHSRATYVSGLSGFLFWAEYSEKSPLPSGAVSLSPVPVDVVRELGIIVANRRQPDFDQALAATSMFIRSTVAKLDERFLSSVLFSLSYLLHELDYSFVENKNLPFNYDDIPKLRLHAAGIAVALKRHHSVDHKTVDDWISVAKKDPLPEIRKVTSELSNENIVSMQETITDTESLYDILRPLMRKNASKKDREYVQQLLARIEIDIVEEREADLKTVTLAVCHSAKLTLVSKANAFGAFVKSMLPAFTILRDELSHIFEVARADNCAAPDDTLEAIHSAFELKLSATQPSSNQQGAVQDPPSQIRNG